MTDLRLIIRIDELLTTINSAESVSQCLKADNCEEKVKILLE